MRILVDTSIWIDYFKNGENSAKLDDLLENNQIVINNIILAELEPFLILKKQYKLIELLHAVTLLPLQINWTEIIQWQACCLAMGINGVGIPDLLIAQNAAQNNSKIYTLDKHFQFISQVAENISLLS